MHLIKEKQNIKMENTTITPEGRVRINKPKWLRVKLPIGENYKKVRSEEIYSDDQT